MKEATTKARTGSDILLLLRRLLVGPASLHWIQVEKKSLTHFLLCQASFVFNIGLGHRRGALMFESEVGLQTSVESLSSLDQFGALPAAYLVDCYVAHAHLDPEWIKAFSFEFIMFAKVFNSLQPHIS